MNATIPMNITNASPSKKVLRVVNPMLRTVLKSPLNGIAPSQLIVMSFTGRKSGKAYQLVLGWHEIDGEHLVFSQHPWIWNFAHGARAAEVIRGSSKQQMSGILVKDPEVIAPKFAEAIARSSDRALGVKMTSGHTITPEDVRVLERKMLVLT